MEKNIKIITLSNGIRVVLQHKHSAVVYCGLMIGAGSAEEQDNERGIAHFIEHILFKGTKKRTAQNICVELEREGGELNACTEKESTIVYAIVQKSEFEKALELISDLVLNSTFPDNELEKEKSVIMSEIDSSTANTSDVIYDKSTELLFKGDTIGHPVLGTKKTVKSFTRSDVYAFMKRTYLNEKMVLSVVGNIDIDNLEKLAQKYLGLVNNHAKSKEYKVLSVYKPYNKQFSSDSTQAFCIIGNRAYGALDNKYLGLGFLTNLLGGPLSSSRLNMNLREKNGLVYDISANYDIFKNTGAFQIYFETAKRNLKHSIKLVLDELDYLTEKQITKTELEYAKHQFIGQLAIATENSEQQMIDNAKSLLLVGKIESVEDLKNQIKHLTSKNLNNIAKDIFCREKLSYISYI